MTSTTTIESGPGVDVGLESAGTGRLKMPGAVSAGEGSSVAQLNGVKEENLQEIKAPVMTKAEAGPTILEAHENLIGFDPRNIPKFKDVVEFLREDLGQSGKS